MVLKKLAMGCLSPAKKTGQTCKKTTRHLSISKDDNLCSPKAICWLHLKSQQDLIVRDNKLYTSLDFDVGDVIGHYTGKKVDYVNNDKAIRFGKGVLDTSDPKYGSIFRFARLTDNANLANAKMILVQDNNTSRSCYQVEAKKDIPGTKKNPHEIVILIPKLLVPYNRTVSSSRSASFDSDATVSDRMPSPVRKTSRRKTSRRKTSRRKTSLRKKAFLGSIGRVLSRRGRVPGRRGLPPAQELSLSPRKPPGRFYTPAQMSLRNGKSLRPSYLRSP